MQPDTIILSDTHVSQPINLELLASSPARTSADISASATVAKTATPAATPTTATTTTTTATANKATNTTPKHQHQQNNHYYQYNYYDMADKLKHHSLFDEQIICSQLSIAAKKDFEEEVRALLDVRKFVSESIVLLEIGEVRIGAIVELIVDRLVEARQLGDQVAEEAKALLCVERNSLSMVLANTMQGLYKSKTDGRLAYDHSWLVAICSLASLSKRQVAIARFAQPVNFGRQSQEVRFLITVLAPSKEKLTKSGWETGRTFATMFTDIDFRRRLLRSKSQDEFKAELLIKAEALARRGELSSLDCQINCEFHDGHQSFKSGLGAGLPDECNNFVISRQAGACDRQPTATQLAAAAAATTTTTATTNQTRSAKLLQDDARDSCCSLGANCSFFGSLGSGLNDDFKRRLGYYASDFLDGMATKRDVYKTISTTVFLYFSVLLPCIAFGVVDTNNTEGQIDPKKTMIGQAIGGLLFALFSGQPLIVMMTTAPLCIYVKVIYQISQDMEVEFGIFYACVGLWMSFFLIVMSLTNSSNLMRYCTQSTENIFALFTAFAFGSDGIKEAVRSFNKYYWDPECQSASAFSAPTSASVLASPASLGGQPSLLAATSSGSITSQMALAAPLAASQLVGGVQQHPLVLLSRSVAAGPVIEMLINNHTSGQQSATISSAAIHGTDQLASSNAPPISGPQLAAGAYPRSTNCQRETCILFLFLMSGTLFLANSFSAFNRTPYLSSRKREIIKDYALAISVLIFSFIGSYLFSEVKLDVFEFSEFTGLHFAQLTNPSIAQQVLTFKVLLATSLLGFMLSVLFYIDQNICGAMVNNAPYKLKKGDYFHLDLFFLAILNALLSLTGLPWMHGKLPHSHLHSKALADYEERVDDGHVQQMIVNIRETRLSQLLCSLLIGLSLFAVPYPLAYIPMPVLSGVFLYTALAEFKSNSLVERICLLFTEQAAYPPNHYIRRCPQRKIHYFTLAQCIQLALVSLVGFYPNAYVNMSFPLVVATFVPIRELLLPRLIDSKYLNSLDSASME